MACVEFTEQEADALLKLIDIAVKNSGMMVAEAGVILDKKIRSAFAPKEDLEVTDKDKKK